MLVPPQCTYVGESEGRDHPVSLPVSHSDVFKTDILTSAGKIASDERPCSFYLAAISVTYMISAIYNMGCAPKLLHVSDSTPLYLRWTNLE